MDQSGWKVSWNGCDVVVPGSHQPLRGNGAHGWSSGPKREALREAGFAAPDQAVEKVIAQDLQSLIWKEAPVVPLGSLRPPMAYRRSLTGVLAGGSALFWNVRRA